MEIEGWIVLGVVNVPVYWGLGWVMFNSWDEFGEAIRFWITPDLFSAFRGEFVNDWWAELKLGVWASGCMGCVYGEAFLIDKKIA